MVAPCQCDRRAGPQTPLALPHTQYSRNFFRSFRNFSSPAFHLATIPAALFPSCNANRVASEPFTLSNMSNFRFAFIASANTSRAATCFSASSA
jgi:hypothetical protein